MSKNDVIRQLGGCKRYGHLVLTRSPLWWHLHARMEVLCQPAIEAGEAELAKPDPEPVMWGSWAWDGMKNVCSGASA